MKAASKQDKPSFYYHELKTIWLKTNEVKQSTTQRVKRGFWENLKGYYYTVRKSITWKLSVVPYRVKLCKTLKDFTYSNNNLYLVKR